jgi:hypothetical protein
LVAGCGVALLSRRAPELVNPEDDLPTTPIGRLKRAVAAGEWERVWPSLLVIGGMTTFMLFGSLSLILVADRAPSGGSMLLVAVVAIGKLVRDWQRGE